MTSWKIDPAGVEKILTGVGTEQEGLIAALGDGEFEAIFTGISEAGGLIAKVPEALQALMQNQKSNLQAVTNRVAAGAAGVKGPERAGAGGVLVPWLACRREDASSQALAPEAPTPAAPRPDKPDPPA